MKNEISAVVYFLSKLLKNNEKLQKGEIEMFSEELSRILHDKYVNHWYPDTPTKGQAYRCIRVNKFYGVDPDLQKACLNCGLMYEDLGLPKEITLWVDPCEVCCRYGEKNPSFVVASFESKASMTEPSQNGNYPSDKATSDYHSGSSSDDEVYIRKRSPPAPVMTTTYDVYQMPEYMLQTPPPSWGKNPKRRQASHYHYQPRFLSGYPDDRHKVYGAVQWLPPVMQNEGNQWASIHVMGPGHQCLG